MKSSREGTIDQIEKLIGRSKDSLAIVDYYVELECYNINVNLLVSYQFTISGGHYFVIETITLDLNVAYTPPYKYQSIYALTLLRSKQKATAISDKRADGLL